MSIVALILMEIYIIVSGGSLLNLVSLIKVFGLILLSTLASTSMVFFLVSFFKSQSAFSTASTIIGTLIGFITGIYLPIGILPELVQYIIKIFPISHATVLFRQVIMEPIIQVSFAGVPVGHTISSAVSILVLIVTIVVFYGLAILNLS